MLNLLLILKGYSARSKVRDEVYEDADRPEIYEEMALRQLLVAELKMPIPLKFLDGEQSRRVTAAYFIATGAKAFILQLLD